MKVFFLVDPLESFYGPLRPPLLIARELKGRFDFVLVSPLIKKEVEGELEALGLPFISLKKRFFFSGSLLTFEAWLRGSKFKANSEDIVVNFSQHFLADSNIYYAQGPITRALDDIMPELRLSHRLIYRLSRPLLVKKDKEFARKIRRRSNVFVANSKFCASMYEDWGLHVDRVIYPPLDCERFKPAKNPSSDYILTYAGKETKYRVIKKLADAGIEIRVFGSKAPVPSQLLRHERIQILGRVSDDELIYLYSNALLTLFTFTHEPFGYIPIESMACGTPVLTYERQGPRESVSHGISGWTVRTDDELITLAIKLWNEGYPQKIRSNARMRALSYDSHKIAEEWHDLLKSFS